MQTSCANEHSSVPYQLEEATMQKYECTVCGYVYDPAVGDPDNDIPAGTSFDDLPEDWVCPDCGVEKEWFEPYED